MASVNGESITADEFIQYLKTKDSVRVVTNQGVGVAQVADTLAFQGLQDLIIRKLVIQIAKDENVYPDDKLVVQELEFRKKLNTNFVQQLTSRGLTLERIKDQLRLELATERILTKGITITDTELDKFIKANKLDKDPATADMLWVWIRSEAAKSKVDTELAGGQSFTQAALRYSEAANAKQMGGRFQERVLARFTEPLRKLIEATPEGRTTTWVPVENGFAKFYVEKKTPEMPTKLDPAKREYVRREIAKGEGRRAKDMDKRLADKLFESEKTIIVQSRELQEMWKSSMERAKQERKVELPTATGQDAGIPPVPGK